LSIRKLRPEEGCDAYVGRIARGIGASPAGIVCVRCRLGFWPYGCWYARLLLPSFDGLLALFFSLDPCDRRFVAFVMNVFRRKPVR